MNSSTSKSMRFSKLWAKSPTDEPWKGSATYVGHISAVMDAAEALLEYLTDAIFDALKLSVDRQKFRATVMLAAYLHDWGKASEHFQVMVRLKKKEYWKTEDDWKWQPKYHQRWRDIGEKQLLRHEIISGLLALGIPEYRNWLQHPDSKADLMVAVWAGMGHHLKIGGIGSRTIDEIVDTQEIFKNPTASLTIFTRHNNFQALLRTGVKRLNLPTDMPTFATEMWQGSELERMIDDLGSEFKKFEKRISKDSNCEHFIAAVKATLIAADIAGSALPKVQGSIMEIKPFIEACLKNVLSQNDIQRLLDKRLEGKALRPFQEEIARSPSRITLVRAGCGTGKTVAAYEWAKTRAVGKKLYFCYPTTGTTTEGFKDYAAQNDFETLLMHSRAEIDREKIEIENILFSAEGEYDRQSVEGDSDPERIDLRLSSFEPWQAKLIVATVDSVLGLLQNHKKPLFSWPAIIQSAFVFDEVHSYDETLFQAFLRFLETFRGSQILLMSASFTEGQLTAIRNTVASLGESLEEVSGPKNLEILDRYIIHRIDSENSAWEAVKKALAESTSERPVKILWVTNTVDSCIAIYKQVCKMEDLPTNLNPRIYHSRFRYKDRQEKHKAVVADFKGNGPAFAITTQVCEMSLDLSATLLISAMAPASALIQRLGRLNRKVIEAEKTVQLASGGLCSALIYPWQDKFPYEPSELNTGPALLDRLSSGPINQKNLAEAAAQLGSPVPRSGAVNWLDGHWRSHPGILREASYSITALLQQDLPKIQAISKDRRSIEIQQWTVPIPLKGEAKKFASWPREGVYPIAPKDVVTYCRNLGVQVN